MENNSEYKFDDEFAETENYDDFMNKVNKLRADKEIPIPRLIRKLYIDQFKLMASNLCVLTNICAKHSLSIHMQDPDDLDIVAYFGTSEILEMKKKAKEMKKAVKDLK